MTGSQRTPGQTALVRCGLLTASTLVIWLLLLVPAWSLAGVDGVEGLSYAALLCLLPGWLVFFAGSRYRDPSTQGMVIALGGATLRLLFGLFGTLLVLWTRPNLNLREFLVWIIIFYLATLTVETLIVISGNQSKSA